MTPETTKEDLLKNLLKRDAPYKNEVATSLFDLYVEGSIKGVSDILPICKSILQLLGRDVEITTKYCFFKCLRLVEHNEELTDGMVKSCAKLWNDTAQEPTCKDASAPLLGNNNFTKNDNLNHYLKRLLSTVKKVWTPPPSPPNTPRSSFDDTDATSHKKEHPCCKCC